MHLLHMIHMVHDMMHMIDLQKSILFVEKNEAQQGNL